MAKLGIPRPKSATESLTSRPLTAHSSRFDAHARPPCEPSPVLYIPKGILSVFAPFSGGRRAAEQPPHETAGRGQEPDGRGQGARTGATGARRARAGAGTGSARLTHPARGLPNPGGELRAEVPGHYRSAYQYLDAGAGTSSPPWPANRTRVLACQPVAHFRHIGHKSDGLGSKDDFAYKDTCRAAAVA